MKCKNCGCKIRKRSSLEMGSISKYVHIQTLQEALKKRKEGIECSNPEPETNKSKLTYVVTSCCNKKRLISNCHTSTYGYECDDNKGCNKKPEVKK